MRYLVFMILILCQCSPVSDVSQTKVPVHTSTYLDSMDQVYYVNGAGEYHYLDKRWDEWVDRGIAADSTIASFWQLKALPLWKTRKYKLAIDAYDRAVRYDRLKYLSRSGFLKCIFAKEYERALVDLDASEAEFGPVYENDHFQSFYAALCHLMLDRPQLALDRLVPDMDKEIESRGVENVHYLEHFYRGIILYELDRYDEALKFLDYSLDYYPRFSDAQYWKGQILLNQGHIDDGNNILREGKMNYEKGNTIYEDSSPYELYPYQITWEWERYRFK